MSSNDLSSNASSGVQMPAFDTLADLFVELGALGSPSECHGVLCGQLCAGARLSGPAWLALAAQQLDLKGELSGEHSQVLGDLYAATLAQFGDGDFAFQPLVPEADESLNQRASALGEWCQGFLAGFGLANSKALSSCSEELQGALQDFSQIAQIVDDTDSNEENEADLMEVFEYVRMAAMLIFVECNQGDQADSAPEVLH